MEIIRKTRDETQRFQFSQSMKFKGLAIEGNPKKKKKLDIEPGAKMKSESGNSRIPIQVKRKRMVRFDENPMQNNDYPHERLNSICEIVMKMERDLDSFCRSTSQRMEEFTAKLQELERSNAAMHADCMSAIGDLQEGTRRQSSDVVTTPNLKMKNLRMPPAGGDRRMAEAVRLYNDLNDGFGSPVTDRDHLQTPDLLSKKYMAIKLQKQCLMLCETPNSSK